MYVALCVKTENLKKIYKRLIKKALYKAIKVYRLKINN